MCGIAGILDFKGRNSESAVIKMTQALFHRGPDAEGIFSEEGVGLGHRRLSIIDLSSAANQPFSDAAGRFVTVYNGEIYNFNDIRQKLKDYPFRTSSDTETMLAAYACWGIRALELFKGMFAFAIWDRQEKELMLVRDRMGVKPLYYYCDEEKLLFASEIRAILASGLVPRKINKNGIYEYLSYQSVSYPLTLVEGIYQLEAGSYLKVRNGEIEKKTYWKIPGCASSFSYEHEEVVKTSIRKLLVTSVERRLVSDVPVGAFLSGGIDSSTVVGIMAQDCGVKPDTFNISFSEKEFDESAYANIIAQKFKTNHTTIRLSPEIMLEELENALSALDTPSGDGVNSFVVSKAIKKAGISVALSGIGGDELFAGYPIFSQFQRLNRMSNRWQMLKPFRLAGSKLLFPGKFDNKKYRLADLLKCRTPDIEHVYPVLRNLLSGKMLKMLTGVKPHMTALEEYLLENKAMLGQLPVLSQVSAAEYMGYTQHTLLKDTDQMSMAVALEVREPFFDTDLIEYVLGIPDKMKQPLYPKSLLVESIKPLLPDGIVHRKKQGFVFPWSTWMKNDLQAFCNQYLKRLGEREFINGKELSHYWSNFLKGDTRIRWMDIWVFVVLEYWLEKNGMNA